MYTMCVCVLKAKQKDVTSLLTEADVLAASNQSYQDVYAAMARALAEAWVDLNKQLELRKLLLDQSVAFYQSAQQVRSRSWALSYLACNRVPLIS
jgi:hypothetical protein